MRPTKPSGLTSTLLATSNVTAPPPTIIQSSAAGQRTRRDAALRTRAVSAMNGSGSRNANPCSLVDSAMAAAAPRPDHGSRRSLRARDDGAVQRQDRARSSSRCRGSWCARSRRSDTRSRPGTRSSAPRSGRTAACRCRRPGRPVPTPNATLSSRPIIASTNSARSGSAKPYGYSALGWRQPPVT